MTIDLPDNTPILVGVGEYSERRGTDGYRALSPAMLAAEAAKVALDDASLAGGLGPKVDVVAVVRTTADSRPASQSALASPFGAPNNSPGAIAHAIGATGARGFYSPACGDEPQKLVGEFCEQLQAGKARLVVICGGEATSTVRAAVAAGEQLDWRDDASIPLEDRGPCTDGLRSPHMGAHRLLSPLQVYPLFEQARRKRVGLSREQYRGEIGRLFAPFTEVAAANPHAFSRKRMSAQDIARVDADHRMVADPFTRIMVAREQVNLAAAVVLTTVGFARELGIPEDRWVFLHGYSSTAERSVMERADLGRSPAMAAAYRGALSCADVSVNDVRYMDIYSCFPIAVFAAADALGIAVDDPRGLTVTGGLPYFGGPGNNYSMHAIVRVAQALRADPGSVGMVGANGGFLSTHAVGIYSTTPCIWRSCDSTRLQAEIDGMAAPAFEHAPNGAGTVESYTVLYDKNGPTAVVVVGRLLDSDARFLATNADGDEQTIRRFVEDDGCDAEIAVSQGENRNGFTVPGAS